MSYNIVDATFEVGMGVDVCGKKMKAPFLNHLWPPMAKKKSVRKAGKDGTRMMIHQRVHNVFFLSEESNS